MKHKVIHKHVARPIDYSIIALSIYKNLKEDKKQDEKN